MTIWILEFDCIEKETIFPPRECYLISWIAQILFKFSPGLISEPGSISTSNFSIHSPAAGEREPVVVSRLLMRFSILIELLWLPIVSSRRSLKLEINYIVFIVLNYVYICCAYIRWRGSITNNHNKYVYLFLFCI